MCGTNNINTMIKDIFQKKQRTFIRPQKTLIYGTCSNVGLEKYTVSHCVMYNSALVFVNL